MDLVIGMIIGLVIGIIIGGSRKNRMTDALKRTKNIVFSSF